jgi:hypothetical protein
VAEELPARPLEAWESSSRGPYVTIRPGGVLDGTVTLTATGRAGPALCPFAVRADGEQVRPGLRELVRGGVADALRDDRSAAVRQAPGRRDRHTAVRAGSGDRDEPIERAAGPDRQVRRRG